MPTYLYKCNKCGNEFEEVHKIVDREIPLKSPCDMTNFCDGELKIVPQMPSMVSMRDTWRGQTDDGWKDTLREIKKNNPGSTLDV
jgi:putative FmdB family regulatory protein